jgi:gamma-glutamyltranspeptidase/glutathione hydrolase
MLSEKPVEYSHGCVSAAHPMAVEAGVNCLRKGGNAVDAALTTAFALHVLLPAFSGIGGGGSALIWSQKPRKPTFVNYREKAPMKASPAMYAALPDGTVPDKSNSVGHRAVAVPGALAGESLLLSKFGTISLKEAMLPAIRYAENGFQVSRALNDVLTRSIDKLKRFPCSAEIFLKGSTPYSIGERMVLKDLARTLRHIADEGADLFYEGEIGDIVAEDMRRNNGLLTKKDLAAYRPRLMTPLHSTYRGYDVHTSPPPFGGAAVIEVLHAIERFDVFKMGHNSPETLSTLSQAMAIAYEDKAKYLGDPRFKRIPLKKLLSREYAGILSKKVASETRLSPWTEPPHGDSTTHLTVVDAQENVVAMTETIECYFGSGVTVPETGILLNDEMHDFDPRPRRANSVGPGKQPASNQSPTVVSEKGSFVLALGSAGGSRIISAVVQTISNVLDHHLDIAQATSAPRIHCEHGTVHVEGRIPRSAEEVLRQAGKKVNFRNEFDIYFGGVHAVSRAPSRKALSGAADPRRDGVARGF